jgi:hypothetical protein
MPTYEKELRKILAEYGCAFHRQGKGGSAQSPNAISQSTERSSRATANEVLKQAGTGKKF